MMTMTPEELEKEVEGHEPRWRALKEYLNDCNTIIDVGAGTGMLSRNLPGKLVINYDNNPKYVDYMKYKHNLVVYNMDWNEPIECEMKADAVVLSEVLEHQENPGLMLTNAFNHASKKVVITLPLTNPDEPDHKWNIRVGNIGDTWAIIEFIRRVQ